MLAKRTSSVRVGCRSLMQQTPWSGGPGCTYFAYPSLVPKHTRVYKDQRNSKIDSNQRLIWSMDSLAEWSKALAPGASPQGRGFEPHSCHFSTWIKRSHMYPCVTKMLGSLALQTSSDFDAMSWELRFCLAVATKHYEGCHSCLGIAESIPVPNPIGKNSNCPPSSVGRAQGP